MRLHWESVLMPLTIGLYAISNVLAHFVDCRHYFDKLVLGTSWLWLRFWPLRPVLIIPGIVLALMGDFMMCAPNDSDKDAVLSGGCVLYGGLAIVLETVESRCDYQRGMNAQSFPSCQRQTADAFAEVMEQGDRHAG